MMKTTSISVPEEVFEMIDDVRGSIPRSTFISDIICEHLLMIEENKGVKSNNIERVYIDFNDKTTKEFNDLLEFYKRFSMQGITQAQFFNKIFDIGTRNMRTFMNNKIEFDMRKMV